MRASRRWWSAAACFTCAAIGAAKCGWRHSFTPARPALPRHRRGGRRALLDRLFESKPPMNPDWQQVACALALRGRLTLITGGPGTGKTYTAARLLVLLQALHGGAPPLRVALAAPTGKAAARCAGHQPALQGWTQRLPRRWHCRAGSPCSARRARCIRCWAQPGTRRLRHDAAQPLDVDLLIVDEASMVHLEMMAQLLEALPARARVVLLGDKDQLAWSKPVRCWPTCASAAKAARPPATPRQAPTGCAG
jgi:ATP-dependent exoDNAse (exonuclease V) alpha subunit